MVEEFRSLLWKSYGPRLKGIVLYGSYARGDYEQGSDVDLLVLMEDSTDVHREDKTVLDAALKTNDKHLGYGTLLSPRLVREKDYQYGKSPFFLNVKREGISFAPWDRIDMQPGIDDLLGRARRELGAVRLLLDQGYYDVAASRAYYAMFYAAEAALLSRGITRSRHSGVIAAFGEYFVRTGLLPGTLSADLSNAFAQRAQADYGPSPFPPDTAEAVLRDAESFVSAVEGLLAS